MMRRMREWLEIIPPGDRIILTGHNFHMGKDSVAMVRRRKAMWRSIGTRLNEALPGRIYTIWMLYDHGHHLEVNGPDLVREVKSNRRSLEHLLAKVGSCFVLPLGSDDPEEDYLADYRQVSFNGRPTHVVVKRNADAILFVREVRATYERI